MTGNDLFDGMSYVDERFVDEAEKAALPKRMISPWIKAVSMAACLCLVLFSLHTLFPELAPEDPGSVADTAPNGSLTDPQEQLPQDSNIGPPGELPTGEGPSVILRVDEMTDTGFVGTVAKLTDTDIFKTGMELSVVVADGTRHETADGNPADSRTDYSGRYVMVQFVEYNRETGTMVVNLIAEADPPN